MKTQRIAMCIALALSLSNCGGDDDSGSDPVSGQPTPTPSSSPVVSPAPDQGNYPQPQACEDQLADEKSGNGGDVTTYSDLAEAESAEHNLIIKTEGEEGFAEGTTSGSALRMEKTGDLKVIWKNLEVKETGLAEFVIIGSSPWGTKFQDVTIYDAEGNVVFQNGNFEMANSGDNPKTWAEYPVYAELEAGFYDLEVGDDWGFVFFDAIKVREQAVVLDSALNLEQVNFYKNLQNPLEFRIEYNNNRLLGFEIDGNPVNFSFGASCDQAIIANDDLTILEDGSHELKAVFEQGDDASANIIVKSELTQPENQRYEAELQSTGRGVTINREKTDSNASNDGYIEFDNKGSVEFVVLVPEAGKYELTTNYRVGNSDAKRKLFVNGQRMRTAIGFRYAQQWDNTAKWILPLKSGVNTITLAPDHGYLALDYLEISDAPLVTEAEIHPHRNTIYLGDHLKPLRIKIDPINQKLTSISDSNGNSYSYTTEESVISSDGHDIQILEGGFWAEISKDQLSKLSAGKHTFELDFDDGSSLPFELEVIAEDSQKVAELTLTFFDVSHGLAVLMQMPDGTNIMADTGKHDMNEQRVRPFLIANQIPLHEIWTSHRHGDHWGGNEKLLEAYADIPASKVKNNQSLVETQDDGCTPAGETPFKRGDILEYGDVTITVQNAHGDQCNNNYLDFNPNSLSFRLEYKGFSFGFQGDIYGQQQDENLNFWGEDASKFDLLQSNHHWHGSISPEYVKKTGADLIIVSASEHVWGAGSFTQDGMAGVNWLKANNPSFMERLFTFDSGHIVVKVFEDGTWTYETIDRQSVGYTTDDSVENVLGYPTNELNELIVGNFKGYAKETRPFPLPKAVLFSANGSDAALVGDFEIRNETTAYMRGEENSSASWTFSVPDAGDYEIRIRYTSDNDGRKQNIVIDGEDAQERVFPTTSNVSAATYTLSEGEHTFSIVKNWGWMEIHGIDIVAVESVVPNFMLKWQSHLSFLQKHTKTCVHNVPETKYW